MKSITVKGTNPFYETEYPITVVVNEVDIDGDSYMVDCNHAGAEYVERQSVYSTFSRILGNYEPEIDVKQVLVCDKCMAVYDDDIKCWEDRYGF